MKFYNPIGQRKPSALVRVDMAYQEAAAEVREAAAVLRAAEAKAADAERRRREVFTAYEAAGD